jgi:hypothetical protein
MGTVAATVLDSSVEAVERLQREWTCHLLVVVVVAGLVSMEVDGSAGRQLVLATPEVVNSEEMTLETETEILNLTDSGNGSGCCCRALAGEIERGAFASHAL